MNHCIRQFRRLSLLLSLSLLAVPGWAGQAQSIAMQQAASGAYYVDATLAGAVQPIATSMLLDTGSGYVSLSKQTFKQLEHSTGTLFLRKIRGVMADGKVREVPVYLVSELKLTDECVLRDIEVAVLNGADRDILGLSALKQLQPFTLQLDPPVLTATCG